MGSLIASFVHLGVDRQPGREPCVGCERGLGEPGVPVILAFCAMAWVRERNLTGLKYWM